MKRSEAFGIAAIFVGNTFLAGVMSLLATPGIGGTGKEAIFAMLYFSFFIVLFASLALRSVLKTGQGLGIAAFALPVSWFFGLMFLIAQAGWNELEESRCAKSAGKWDNMQRQCSGPRS